MRPGILFSAPPSAAEERTRRRARLLAVLFLSMAAPLWALTIWLVLRMTGHAA